MNAGYAEDRPYAMVACAVLALRREGHGLVELACDRAGPPCRWSQAVAACLARGDCRGGVVFCEDPGLVCCVANKVPGLRAVAVTTVGQAARAAQTLGANLLAVEMPGRTYFEVRQILRLLCTASGACPADLAGTLRELDGHAHR
jgi:ribose 5-phosphate isomerase RpiB